ncbi:FabD/lysophospholipase-like protein [Patellaria atrata CBS 101060]|uniref:FabD/lysophospholipase-like protein n=1 Tax=Patellaria atrata CBS 101060 TaxID=1346257 RepID=A0A9P4VM56_9PEZI|nr:FabD/lysophospholipase-like protein [Patellaria atrata CBS 101060]
MALSPPSNAHSPTRPLSVLSSSTIEHQDDLHTGRSWASTVKSPWDSMILTLDGGGIRGYSSLLILKELMREVAEWENKFEEEEGPISGTEKKVFKEEELLPCVYFDMMYGTSTGGLIATMLGRLRMTVSQCLTIYRRVGDDLFGHPRKRRIIPLTTKYDHEPLENAVKRIVKENCPVHPAGECDGLDWFPWDLDHGDILDFDQEYATKPAQICHSICLTATHNGSIDEAHLLRTYPHQYVNIPNWITEYNAGADPLRIWEVTRATSAAPFYFKILEADIRGEMTGFKDGGIRENNPSGAAWSEFISIYGEESEPGLLLSIGTGRSNENQDGFASAWPGPFGERKIVRKWAEKFAVFKNVLIKYTEGESKHKAMVHQAKGEHGWYKRLNVSEGLEKMKLDNWEKGSWRDPRTGEEKVVPGGKSLTRMEEATGRYLSRERNRRFDTYAAPSVMVSQVAEKLVRQRRARERTRETDPVRWERFVGALLRPEPAAVVVESP